MINYNKRRFFNEKLYKRKNDIYYDTKKEAKKRAEIIKKYGTNCIIDKCKEGYFFWVR
jgi:hypothetical protein